MSYYKMFFSLKPIILLAALLLSSALCAQGNTKSDWLLQPSAFKAKIDVTDKELTMHNGLVARKIRIAPNAATVEFKNLQTGESMLRSIKPEAEITLNNVRYAVGGLSGLKEHGYFIEDWIDDLTQLPGSFQYSGYSQRPLAKKINWKKNHRYHTANAKETTGQELILHFKHNAQKLRGITVNVHYEIYDGLPLIAKWISLENDGGEPVELTAFKSELLAYPEVENPVETPKRWRRPNMHVESDYAFGGFSSGASNVTTFWEADQEYSSQVNWKRETPCLLVSKLAVGPKLLIDHGTVFESFHTYELLLNGQDRERNSLSIRKMYRGLAPWVTENPIFMHLTTVDPDSVKTAINQAASTGYEMVILSFGSGLSMEDTTAGNIKKFRKLADYAHKKGIELGGYSLFSSRKISDSVDVIDKKTGQPGGAKFGNAPCLASEWGYQYLEKVKYFLSSTGFDLLEHDGPYPGDYCASEKHAYHNGYEDSQWKQWQMTRKFYNWLREEGIYLNAPDFYFLQGSSKCGIGYREVNWSLPRDQQIILGRQNIYDGTWEKAPSMAWTFVPLTEYHGGGAAATLEPLSEHLDAYKAHMVQNYGSGVQACYRGPRLYDTNDTKKLVIDQITHYKKYREILNADIIHLRRPTGRSWDGIMHVNATLENKAFVLLFNPTSSVVSENIRLPLYYTGLTDNAKVLVHDKASETYQLNREFEIDIQIEIPAKGYTWLVIR